MTVGVLPVLYSFRRCPYAMRARMAIAASGVQCELREIVLRDKPAAMLQASPKGTVPVLVDTDGTVVDQSLDIMLWALRKNDPQDWLHPLCVPKEQFDLIGQCDQQFKPHLDRYKYPQRYADTQAEPHRQAGLEWLMMLEARLAKCEWLFGPKPALADFAIAPFVRQYAHTDLEWFTAQPIPETQRWLAAFLASSVFLSVMQKYPVWQEGQPGVIFPA